MTAGGGGGGADCGDVNFCGGGGAHGHSICFMPASIQQIKPNYVPLLVPLIHLTAAPSSYLGGGGPFGLSCSEPECGKPGTGRWCGVSECLCNLH